VLYVGLSDTAQLTRGSGDVIDSDAKNIACVYVLEMGIEPTEPNEPN